MHDAGLGESAANATLAAGTVKSQDAVDPGEERQRVVGHGERREARAGDRAHVLADGVGAGRLGAPGDDAALGLVHRAHEHLSHASGCAHDGEFHVAHAL